MRRPLILAAVVLLAAQAASACPVCFGAPSEPMVKGMSNGILVLLGLIGFVQLGFIALFWSFWRRAREHQKLKEQFHLVTVDPQREE